MRYRQMKFWSGRSANISSNLCGDEGEEESLQRGTCDGRKINVHILRPYVWYNFLWKTSPNTC